VYETDGWNILEFHPVQLLDIMGDDDSICDAARVSFDKVAANYSDEQNQGLLNYLARHDHWTPFAHQTMKFRFRAPIFVARQFVKHCVGFVWNEVSRRYVDSDPWFYIPSEWRKRPDNMKQGSIAEGAVPVIATDLEKKFVHKMREHARDYKDLRMSGVCPEQARMILPQNMMTEWIWTGSLMAWARFVDLRSDSHAQAECWPYAEQVRYAIKNAFPKAERALFTQGDNL